jgi:long-chain acyl-CoA synthetase
VADGSTRLTYRQLGQLSHALARRLEDTGINRTDTVALYSDNCLEYVVALLAAWTVGAAVTHIDPQLTAAEVRTRLTAVSAAAVLLPQRLGGSYPADTAATPAWAIEVAADGSTADLTAIRSSGAAEPATPRLGRKGGRVQVSMQPCCCSQPEAPARPRSFRSPTPTWLHPSRASDRGIT